MRIRYLVALVVLVLGFSTLGLLAWRMQWTASEGLLDDWNVPRRISIRTNRFTDRVEFFSAEGWRPLSDLPPASPTPDPYLSWGRRLLKSPSPSAMPTP